MQTRSRTSSIDARVTLIEAVPSVHAKSVLSSPLKRSTSTTSPSTPQSKKRKSEAEDLLDSSPSTSRSTSKSPRKPKPIRLELDKPHPAPKRWEETLDVLTKQRATVLAPVDTMGCTEAGKLESEEGRNDTDDRSKRFQTLVSLMLSSQTKDPVTAEATANLRKNLPGGLTLESIMAASVEEIQQSICKVGFWRRKAEYIKATAQMLKDGEGDVPKTIDGLLALPGVGPKMGFLALQSCWDLNHGIGVDTHVHRITNRLGWHKPETKEAEDTRLNLQSWLPKSLHKSINKTLVGFGQVICLPVGPRCDLCNLAKASLCPSKVKNVKVRPVKKEEWLELIDQAEVKVEVDLGVVEGEIVKGSIVKVDGEVKELRTEITVKEEEEQLLAW